MQKKKIISFRPFFLCLYCTVKDLIDVWSLPGQPWVILPLKDVLSYKKYRTLSYDCFSNPSIQFQQLVDFWIRMSLRIYVVRARVFQ